MEVTSLARLNVVLIALVVCLSVYYAEANPAQIKNLRRFNGENVDEAKQEKITQGAETNSSDEAVLEARQGQCHRSCSKRCVAKEGELTRCRTTCTKRCLVGDEDKDEDEATTTATSTGVRSITGSTVPSATTNTTTNPSAPVPSPTVPTSVRRNRIRNRNQLRNKEFDVVLLALFEETGNEPIEEEETDEPGSSII